MSFSLGGLFLFWSLGLFFPFRKSQAFRDFNRWITNLSLSFGNGFLVFLLIPLSLLDFSLTEQTGEINPLSILPLGSPLKFIVGWAILDLAMYWQHRLSHKWNWLWRLHRVHHSDIEIDTTSAGRFHTIEIFLSFFLKAALITHFQIPPQSVIFFVILLNFAALFNHSNFQIPDWLEKPLRFLIITPDLHRIHHSVIGEEMNSNFGFSISLWDRMFFTYKNKGEKSQMEMKIGLNEFRSKKEQTLWALLLQPFTK